MYLECVFPEAAGAVDQLEYLNVMLELLVAVLRDAQEHADRFIVLGIATTFVIKKLIRVFTASLETTRRFITQSRVSPCALLAGNTPSIGARPVPRSGKPHASSMQGKAKPRSKRSTKMTSFLR
jgi:hypothetical protein